MNGAFYIGATGLSAEQRALEVIASNITNINTSGYKRAQLRFSELLAVQDPATAGALSSPGGQVMGVSVNADDRNFSQGELRATGKPMDVAIDGEGFFELMGPGGQTVLWRGGSLKVDSDGYLAAANGLRLKAMISVPLDATSVAVGPGGEVTAVTGSDAKTADLGQIDLVRVKDTASLTVLGDDLYRPADTADLITAAPGEDGAGRLAPGFVEGSNVELSDEMITLLLLQRAYAANAQVVQAGDQLMAIANGLRR